MKFKANFGLIMLLLIFSVNLYAYEITEKEERTFKFNSGGLLDLTGDDGMIKVTSWDKDEVWVKIVKRAQARSKKEAERLLEKIEVQIEHDNDRLVIRQLRMTDGNKFSLFDLFDPDLWTGLGKRDIRVDFELKVPPEIKLRIENDEGDINITNFSGDIDVILDEGDLSMDDCNLGMTNIDIDEGDLKGFKLTSINDRVSIYTDEGNIWMEECEFGNLRLDCDEGNIILKKVVSKSMELKTDEGDIEAEFEVSGNGRYRFYSDEGDIFIFIDKNADLKIKLDTEDGRIRTNFDLEISESANGERARGKIGRGLSLLEVYTDEGNVELTKR